MNWTEGILRAYFLTLITENTTVSLKIGWTNSPKNFLFAGTCFHWTEELWTVIKNWRSKFYGKGWCWVNFFLYGLSSQLYTLSGLCWDLNKGNKTEKLDLLWFYGTAWITTDKRTKFTQSPKDHISLGAQFLFYRNM